MFIMIKISFFVLLYATIELNSVIGYAQLGETMKCVDGDCSETVSEGRAKLAYQPRDKKFLNLKKGDVVLVKGKKAGLKTDLWGGEVLGSNRFGFFPGTFVKEYIVFHQKPSVLVNMKEFLKKSPLQEDVLVMSSIEQKIKIQKNPENKKESEVADNDKKEDLDSKHLDSVLDKNKENFGQTIEANAATLKSDSDKHDKIKTDLKSENQNKIDVVSEKDITSLMLTKDKENDTTENVQEKKNADTEENGDSKDYPTEKHHLSEILQQELIEKTDKILSDQEKKKMDILKSVQSNTNYNAQKTFEKVLNQKIGSSEDKKPEVNFKDLTDSFSEFSHKASDQVNKDEIVSKDLDVSIETKEANEIHEKINSDLKNIETIKSNSEGNAEQQTLPIASTELNKNAKVSSEDSSLSNTLDNHVSDAQDKTSADQSKPEFQKLYEKKGGQEIENVEVAKEDIIDTLIRNKNVAFEQSNNKDSPSLNSNSFVSSNVKPHSQKKSNLKYENSVIASNNDDAKAPEKTVSDTTTVQTQKLSSNNVETEVDFSTSLEQTKEDSKVAKQSFLTNNAKSYSDSQSHSVNIEETNQNLKSSSSAVHSDVNHNKKLVSVTSNKQINNEVQINEDIHGSSSRPERLMEEIYKTNIDIAQDSHQNADTLHAANADDVKTAVVADVEKYNLDTYPSNGIEMLPNDLTSNTISKTTERENRDHEELNESVPVIVKSVEESDPSLETSAIGVKNLHLKENFTESSYTVSVDINKDSHKSSETFENDHLDDIVTITVVEGSKDIISENENKNTESAKNFDKVSVVSQDVDLKINTANNLDYIDDQTQGVKVSIDDSVQAFTDTSNVNAESDTTENVLHKNSLSFAEVTAEKSVESDVTLKKSFDAVKSSDNNNNVDVFREIDHIDHINPSSFADIKSETEVGNIKSFNDMKEASDTTESLLHKEALTFAKDTTTDHSIKNDCTLKNSDDDTKSDNANIIEQTNHIDYINPSSSADRKTEAEVEDIKSIDDVMKEVSDKTENVLHEKTVTFAEDITTDHLKKGEDSLKNSDNATKSDKNNHDLNITKETNYIEYINRSSSAEIETKHEIEDIKSIDDDNDANMKEALDTTENVLHEKAATFKEDVTTDYLVKGDDSLTNSADDTKLDKNNYDITEETNGVDHIDPSISAKIETEAEIVNTKSINDNLKEVSDKTESVVQEKTAAFAEDITTNYLVKNDDSLKNSGDDTKSDKNSNDFNKAEKTNQISNIDPSLASGIKIKAGIGDIKSIEDDLKEVSDKTENVVHEKAVTFAKDVNDHSIKNDNTLKYSAKDTKSDNLNFTPKSNNIDRINPSLFANIETKAEIEDVKSIDNDMIERSEETENVLCEKIVTSSEDVKTDHLVKGGDTLKNFDDDIKLDNNHGLNITKETNDIEHINQSSSAEIETKHEIKEIKSTNGDMKEALDTTENVLHEKAATFEDVTTDYLIKGDDSLTNSADDTKLDKNNHDFNIAEETNRIDHIDPYLSAKIEIEAEIANTKSIDDDLKEVSDKTESVVQEKKGAFAEDIITNYLVKNDDSLKNSSDATKFNSHQEKGHEDHTIPSSSAEIESKKMVEIIKSIDDDTKEVLNETIVAHHQLEDDNTLQLQSSNLPSKSLMLSKDHTELMKLQLLDELMLELNLLKDNDQNVATQVFNDVINVRNKISHLVIQIKSFNTFANSTFYRLVNHKARNIKQTFIKLEMLLHDYKDANLAESTVKIDVNVNLEKQLYLVKSKLKRRKELHLLLTGAAKTVQKLQYDLVEVMKIIKSIHLNPSLKDIANSLKLEVDKRKKKDNMALLATEREARSLHENLKKLKKYLDDSNFENKDFLSSLQTEAVMLKNRLLALESKLEEKKKVEENHTVISEQKSEELQNRILILEAELQRQKDNEAIIYAVQYEAASLKEKIKVINAKVGTSISKKENSIFNRFAELEKEVFFIKENESEALQQTQMQTLELQKKINDLEKALKNQSKNSSKELTEVIFLKEQLQNLERILDNEKSNDKELIQSALLREKELQKRIESLEKELKNIGSKEQKTQKAIRKSHELIKRISLLEHQLFQGQTHLRSNKDKEELLDVLKEQLESNKITFKKMLEQVVSQPKCPKVNHNELITTFDDTKESFENEVQVASHVTLADCAIIPEKRIQCSIPHAQQALCNALNCCWSHQTDPSVPNCYYSSSQLQLNKKVMLENLSEDDDHQSALRQSAMLPSQDAYEKVHEGKIVNWDESVQEKRKQEMSWDEELGPSREGESEVLETSNVSSEPEELTVHISNESSAQSDKPADKGESISDESNFKELAASKLNKITAQDDELAAEKNNPTFQEDQFTAQKNKYVTKQDDSGAEKKLSVVEKDASFTANDRSIPDKDAPSMAQKGAENLEEFSTEVHHKNNLFDDDQSFSKQHNDDLASLDFQENDVESVILKIGYFTAQFPYNFAYIMTPMALWLNALLPKEYQNDVFGVSWPTICKTFFIGFLILLVFIWRYTASRQWHKEQGLLREIEYTRNYAYKIIKDLTDMENKKYALSKEMKALQEEFQEQNLKLKESLRKHDELEKNSELLRSESKKKSDNLSAITEKIKAAEKEKEHLTNVFKQKDKQLEEKKAAATVLDNKFKAVTKHLEEIKKQNKELEEELKEYQNRLNIKETATCKQEEVIKEAEEKTEKLNNQVKELKFQISALTAEKKDAKQEADILKDCLLQFQGVQESITGDCDEELDSEDIIVKQNEKIKELMDLVKMQRKLDEVEKAKEKALSDLRIEMDLRNKADIKREQIALEAKNCQTLQLEAQRNLELEKSKIASMEQFYSKREIDVAQQLCRERDDCEMYKSTAKESEERIGHLEEQLKTYKEMTTDAKKQYEENDRRLKADIKMYEKKSHSSWLTCKEAERKLDETTRELAQIKREFNDLEERLRETEMREAFHRPRPRGPFDRPPFPQFSPNIRPGGRRSPTGSMHSDRGTPDRPPNFVDRRPPSRNPTGDPLEVGDGMPPRNAGPHRGAPPLKDSPPAEGQLEEPSRETHPSIRDFFGPRMVGGRPPFRPPSRDGPPFDRPPMDNGYPPRARSLDSPSFRDGGPIIRDGPNPMSRPGPPMSERFPYGPPPPMLDTPPSGYHRAPPRMQRPGSGQEIRNPPFGERSILAPRESPAPPPMMPLHGNRPFNNDQNVYELHPAKGNLA